MCSYRLRKFSGGLLKAVILVVCFQVVLLAQSSSPASPSAELQDLPETLQRELNQVVATQTTARPAAYRVRAGDDLEVRAYAITELNTTVRVRPDGKISLVLLGDVEVAGRTPEELSELLASSYSEIFRTPQITVIVRNFYNFNVFVGGQVSSPGLVSLSGDVTVASAVFQAGGFEEEDGPKTVILLRRDESGVQKVMTLDLYDVFLRGEPDTVLQPSDILYVPKNAINVYVGGEVAGPGLVSLQQRMTALAAIMRAGGFKRSARTDSVMLLRDTGQGGASIRKINIKEIIASGTGDLLLQPYDVVYVPKSRIAKVGQFVDEYMRQLLPISVSFGFSYIISVPDTVATFIE